MLRRAREEDIRSFKPRSDDNVDQAVDQITTYRNNVLAALRDPSLERRAGAMRTLKAVLTNWVDELAGPTRKNEAKPASPNGDAKEAVESGAERSRNQSRRPSFSRGGSFRMGFEDVFEGDHDASPARTRTNGEERNSVPPTPPSQLSSRQHSGELNRHTKHWETLAHPANPPPTAEGAMYKRLQETPYCVVFDSELSELLRGGKDKTPGDISKFPPHGSAEKDFLSDSAVRQHLIQFYLGLLRCIGDYPWRDVRRGAKELIKDIEVTDVDLPRLHFAGVHAPSLFIPVTDTVGLRSSPSLSLKGELPVSPVLPSSVGTTPNSSYGVDFGDEDENNRIVEDYFALSFTKTSDNSGMNMPVWSHRVPDSPQMSRKRGQHPASNLAAKGQKKGFGVSSFPSNSLPVHLQSYPRATSPLATSTGNRRKSKSIAAKPKFPTKSALDLYLDLFRSYGRITNIYKVLSFCPRFARARTDLIGHVNQHEYSISMDQRIYLGIMAAAEMKCQYYLGLLQYDYLQIRGKPEWLEGLHKAPLKFQKLAELNTCLAHSPWNIPSKLIKECLAARWNEGDLIMAIMILSFYHTQSAFVMACGIIPEVDLPGGTVKKGAQKDYAAFQATGEFLAHPHGESTSNTIFENDTEEPSHSPKAITKPTSISLLTINHHRATNGNDESINNHADAEQNAETPTQKSNRFQSPERINTEDDKPNPSNRPRAMSSVYGNTKRRQSFVDCAKSDGPIFTRDSAASWSAPGSYFPAPSVTALAGAATAKDNKRDVVLSPHSSFSSITQASSVKSIDFWTRNVQATNYEKFLPEPTATAANIQEEDVESAEDYFLDMADFDWSGDCCSIIGNHFTGFDYALDKYFRITEHVSSESGEPCFAEVVKATKRRLGPLSRVGSLVQMSGDRRSLDFSSLDLGHKNSVSFDLPHVSIESGAAGRPTGLGIGSGGSTGTTASLSAGGSFEFSVHDLHRLDSTSPTPPFTPGHSRRTSTNMAVQEPGYPVKEAIWSYSLRLLGIQKADYHYSDIKLLLSKSTRRFIKRICFAPHLASQADWLGIEGDADGDEGVSMCVGLSAASATGSMSRGMPASVEEKVLIAVLATQARFMGQIMLGIKAVEDSRFA